MWRAAKVAVVIPAYNEERLIASTLAQVPGYVDLIFVVNDASQDGTDRRLEALGSSRVVRVNHTANRGVGAAIVTGYYHALSAGADLIAVMAGDNQMDGSELGTLLDTALSGTDYVKGNRFLHCDAQKMPSLRRLGSRVLSYLTRFTTGLTVDDCQCGYTVIRAGAAAALPLDNLWPRYGYPNDMLALLARSGMSVGDVAVRPVYRDERSGLHAGHMLSIGARIVRRYFEPI